MEMNEHSTCPDMPESAHNAALAKTLSIVCLKQQPVSCKGLKVKVAIGH